MNSENSWLLGSDGDVIIKNHIKLTDENKTIAQRLQNKISLNSGEWFLHNKEGVNWFGNGEIDGNFGRKITEMTLDAQIKEYIKEDKDVSEILDYKATLDEKSNYKIEIKILTKDNNVLNL